MKVMMIVRMMRMIVRIRVNISFVTKTRMRKKIFL